MKTSLKVDCQLGKVNAASQAWHCVAERGPKGARALCKAIGRLTEIEEDLFPVPIPESGSDISTIKGPKGTGFICQNCIRTLREREDARRAPAEAPKTPKAAPKRIDPLEMIAQLKADYLGRKITFATYWKQASHWGRAAREAGQLGRGFTEGEKA